MIVKLGSVDHASYCIEFVVHVNGKKVFISKTHDSGYEFDGRPLTIEEFEALDEWLSEDLVVRLTIRENTGLTPEAKKLTNEIFGFRGAQI